MYCMPSLHAFASTQYADSSYTSRKKGMAELRFCTCPCVRLLWCEFESPSSHFNRDSVSYHYPYATGSAAIEVFDRSSISTPTNISGQRSVHFADPRRSSSRNRGRNLHGERSIRRTETSSGRPSYRLARRRDSHPSGSIYIRHIPGYLKVDGECFEHPRLWGVTRRTRSAGVRSTVYGEYTELLCPNASRDRMGSANEISVPTT